MLSTFWHIRYQKFFSWPVESWKCKKSRNLRATIWSYQEMAWILFRKLVFAPWPLVSTTRAFDNNTFPELSFISGFPAYRFCVVTTFSLTSEDVSVCFLWISEPEVSDLCFFGLVSQPFFGDFDFLGILVGRGNFDAACFRRGYLYSIKISSPDVHHHNIYSNNNAITIKSNC